MPKIYSYLFYRIYSWNLKKWGENDVPEWKALIVTTFLMLLNVSMILILFDIFGIINFIQDATPKKEIIYVFLVVLIANIYRFIISGKYKEIAEYYDKESIDKRKKNTALLWIYTTMSFIAPFGTLILHYEFIIK